MATFTLRVDKRVQETEDTVSLFFRVPGDLNTAFTYRPGQFVALEDDPGGEMISRQYSLSSVPEIDPWMRILSETAAKMDGKRGEDEYARQRIIEMRDFFETCSGWYREIQRLPTPMIKKFLTLGGKMVGLLGLGRS